MPERPLQPPVIVIPGITATVLRDLYPVDVEEVWSALRHKEYERISLHPDDTRYETIEPARLVPDSPFGLVYGDLVEALRHDLSPKKDKPTPVFGFGYDWRQDCGRTAVQLRLFIEEVLARTALLPHYRGAAPTEVDLVGHSMGGLVISHYLRDKQEEQKSDPKVKSHVRRVVTLGTPFRGSIHAIQKLTTGMGFLTGPDPRDREREAARTIPTLYQLLPTYQGAITGEPSAPTNLFDIGTWQPSVLATLREYIRVVKAEIAAEKLLKRYLDVSKAFIDSVNGLVPKGVLREGADAWLPVVGIDYPTHIEAHVEKWQGAFWFSFPKELNDGVGSVRTGDGTVPFLGACPDFLERERLVCVTPQDLSFWELRDRVLVEFAGLHGFLPKLNHVQKLVIRFLRNDFKPDPLEARRAPDAKDSLRWPSWLREKKK